mmetsp:Transcript_16547/g.33955  ORF Transcript_16547/g.33955 Transcript_16547/m.33955 type:complete len:172 (-) Transcript_16547:356-871(-)
MNKMYVSIIIVSIVRIGQMRECHRALLSWKRLIFASNESFFSNGMYSACQISVEIMLAGRGTGAPSKDVQSIFQELDYAKSADTKWNFRRRRLLFEVRVEKGDDGTLRLLGLLGVWAVLLLLLLSSRWFCVSMDFWMMNCRMFRFFFRTMGFSSMVVAAGSSSMANRTLLG